MNTFVISFLTLIVGFFLGTFFTAAFVNTPDPQIVQTPVADTVLQSKACTLYENYQGFYYILDQMCESDNSCKNSASRIELRKTYESWNSFPLTYCNN